MIGHHQSPEGAGWSQDPCSPQIPVGASLLAKAVGLLASMLNVSPPSRAGPLPHGYRAGRRTHVHLKSPVGASLLAMAVGLLASMLNVSPPSRAGPLPHGYRAGRRTHVHLKSPVGASLLAMAVGLLASMSNVAPPSRAGSLPQGASNVGRRCPTLDLPTVRSAQSLAGYPAQHAGENLEDRMPNR
ncbi:hypothetical protein SAMN03159297_05165 [Pseudomonas sp. NFACC45]|nr:hypothetical protein SAMN03159297_05165 [Pseudomonas sp. NFACC45]